MRLSPFRFRLSLLAVLVAGTEGCGLAGESVGPEDSAFEASGPDRNGEALQTDALAYTAVYRSGEAPYRMYGFRIVATFTNRLTVPVFLGRCFPYSPTPIFGIQLVGDTAGAGGWGSIYSRAWACVGHDQQLIVAPGATRVDTLDMLGPMAWQGGVPLGTFDGRLRLVYGVSTCPGDGGCPGAREFEASNAFDVRTVR